MLVGANGNLNGFAASWAGAGRPRALVRGARSRPLLRPGGPWTAQSLDQPLSAFQNY
jgi:hypothetical protein